MRKLLLLAPVLLAGCSAAAPPAATAGTVPQGASGSPATSECRQGDYAQFVGRTRSEALEAELREASGARVIRWVPPGMMVTMDYRMDRMTVRLDAQNRIIAANCG